MRRRAAPISPKRRRQEIDKKERMLKSILTIMSTNYATTL